MPLIVIVILLGIAVAAVIIYRIAENSRLKRHLEDAPKTYAERARKLIANVMLESQKLHPPKGEQYVVGVYDNLLGKMLVWVRITFQPNQITVVVECSNACTGRAVDIADHMHNGFREVGSSVTIEWGKAQPPLEHFTPPSERSRR